jgi:iron(II)-dependent oxidoreductase
MMVLLFDLAGGSMHPALRAREQGSRSTIRLRLLLAATLCSVAVGGCPLFKKTSSKAPSLEGMVLVPAGEFTMGRESEDASPDEAPVRIVWLNTFYIDRLEVTNAQYKAFADSVGRLYPNNPMWDDFYFLGKPDHPVINITYEQAQAYCAWLGKRLPTEAEWEKAARGTDARLYAWGNEWDETRANLWGDQNGPDVFRRTAPVGSFPEGASPYGVLDMVGNVWEWCAVATLGARRGLPNGASCEAAGSRVRVARSGTSPPPTGARTSGCRRFIISGAAASGRRGSCVGVRLAAPAPGRA